MSQSEVAKLQNRKNVRVEVEQYDVLPALRALAPKPSPRLHPLAIRGKSETPVASLRSQQRGLLTRKKDDPCAICSSRSCKLASHKFRARGYRSRLPSTGQQTAKAGRGKAYYASYALRLGACYLAEPVSTSRLDPFHNLPLPEDLNTADMQRLFHDWFIVQAPRHFTVPRPPEMVSDLLHGPFLAPAFADPILCLGILTISAASQRSNTAGRGSNVLALTLLDRSMRMLRARVTASKIFITDTTIAGALYIWAANLYVADEHSLQQHANSVRALVAAREGLVSLGMSGAVANLFRWVDIMSSLRLNRPCYEPDTRELSTPLDPETRYGAYWINQQSTRPLVVDEVVVSACTNCCASITLLEHEKGDVIKPAVYWYLYQRIAQLYQESSILRAKFSNTGTMEECIVLAIDILKLIVFNGGQTRPGRRSLRHQANYLVRAIKATGGSDFWEDHIEMLLWLVVLTCLAEPGPEHQRWCSRVLKGALEFRFGAPKQSMGDYIAPLQALLINFGWSTLSPFNNLENICVLVWPLKDVH